MAPTVARQGGWDYSGMKLPSVGPEHFGPTVAQFQPGETWKSLRSPDRALGTIPSTDFGWDYSGMKLPSVGPEHFAGLLNGMPDREMLGPQSLIDILAEEGEYERLQAEIENKEWYQQVFE